ncbi:hypothetical protein NHX12_033447 [Muraenolepis orangiensis]|uniref:Peptidase S1 domain-containing protein n=1 Tax=Muraenolepis orangiensis TaxID=630683 RepID=A0A9Q0IJN9_9TELE|nr:hypothetical protein NHX12_033447 [Muraenolepis orangiensis]
MASELREVNVTLEDNKICTDRHTYCSYGEEGPGHADSGGPLVCEDGLAFGVVSFRAGEHQMCTVYGKLPDYRGWIERHLNNTPSF